MRSACTSRSESQKSSAEGLRHVADKSGSQGIGGSRRFGAHGSRNSGRSYPIGELMKLQTGVGCLKFWVRACLVAAHLCGPHVIASSKKLSISGRVHAFPKVQLHDLKRLTASAESGMQHTPQESDRTARRPRTVAAVQEKTRSCRTTLKRNQSSTAGCRRTLLP